MQEAFRRAFEERARSAYDGLRPYRRYLLTITRNLVIDQLRKQREGWPALRTVSIKWTRSTRLLHRARSKWQPSVNCGFGEDLSK